MDSLTEWASALFDDYAAQAADVSPDELRKRLDRGIALLADLDIETALKLVTRRLGGDLKTELEGSALVKTAHLQQVLDTLCTLTTRDALTGLFNRRYFDNRFQGELERSRREFLPCSLLFVDVDNFKAINDQHGHDVGDTVLQRIASILTQSLRTTDEVTARLGGEEFAIILPNTDRIDAVQVAERLRALVEGGTRGHADEPSATVSIGVTTHTPPRMSSAQELVKQADLALYEAKGAGRNVVQIFGEQPGKDPGGLSKEERETLLG